MTKFIAITNLGLVGANFESPSTQAPNVQIWGAASNSPPWGPTVPPSFAPVRTFDYSMPDPPSAASPWTSPNYVVMYHDRSVATNPCYMIVGCAYNTGGGDVALQSGVLLVYQFAGLDDIVVNAAPIGQSNVSVAGQPQGMAIQPGTGDLYVATADGGIIVYTNISGYSMALPFSSPAIPSSAYPDCANLAFDQSGNLWLTSFESSDPSTHLLTCFTQVGAVDNFYSDPTQYVQFVNASMPTFTPNALQGAAAPNPNSFYPLSEPNGIAFDPYGNLWLANNDDDKPAGTNPPGLATLLRLSIDWFQPILNDPMNNQTRQTIVPGAAATVTSPNGTPGGTAYYKGYSKFGAVYFDGFTLYVEDEANEGVFTFDTTNISDATPAPAVPSLAFAQATGITASYPGNGGLAIFNTTPATLLIRDGANGGTQEAWESVDIGTSSQGSATTLMMGITTVNAVISSSGAGSVLPSQALEFNANNNTSNYVQVRVANIGVAKGPSTLGSEILKLYWAYASTGLGYPQPWDGEYPDQGTNGLPGGGLVFAKPIPVMAPGEQEIFEFNWTDLPDPLAYAHGAGQHFCLLARIEANSLYPFDMLWPELSDSIYGGFVLNDNVLSNPTVAQRNITIADDGGHRGPKRSPPLPFPVIGANYGPVPVITRFGLTLLNTDGQPGRIDGLVTVSAEGRVAEKLRAICGDGTRLRHVEGGLFHLFDYAAGLAPITLQPNEQFPFELEYAPAHQLRGFVLRVTQYVEHKSVDKVLGGQTFVVGKVYGFGNPS